MEKINEHIRSCKECIFYAGTSHDYGPCKRHSPSISRLSKPDQGPDLWWNEYCEWPNVHKNNWCGDFVSMLSARQEGEKK